MKIVVDTNVLLSAFLKEGNAARNILNLCLNGMVHPIIGNSIFNEYEDVFSRQQLFAMCPLDSNERHELLSAFYAVCSWQKIYYLWWPNLRDETDNHLLEIAIAAGAEYLITENKRDFMQAELLLPSVRILSAIEFMRFWSER